MATTTEEPSDRWNARWAARTEVAAPSPWLTSLGDVPRAGAALDVAGGAGRNALWLAARGLSVTLVDISAAALALAAGEAHRRGVPLALVERDLTHAPPPPGPWDLIVMFHYLQRDLFPLLSSALSPGGRLIASIATVRNLERHPRPPRPYLLDEGELPTLVPDLSVLLHEEGWLDDDRHEARIVAQRAVSGS